MTVGMTRLSAFQRLPARISSIIETCLLRIRQRGPPSDWSAGRREGGGWVWAGSRALLLIANAWPAWVVFLVPAS
ncbi:hypothetical protein P8C59_006260 [Phyllachora maydis]|uniref:Uncharacterized protein n=1 Tax=Phyllachora maydis TaxID=1825666 RepID=A0AAD9I7C0_9PEZI|nr:hypothetical protein P8C59_006260 [Phyllachora maydis]